MTQTLIPKKAVCQFTDADSFLPASNHTKNPPKR